MACIYAICLNKKPVYVGQTIKSAQERFQEHINIAKRNKNGFAIHAAMRKYGIENFSICTLEEIADINEMNNREKYWIEQLHTLISGNGYNMTLGGESCSESLKTMCYQYDIDGNYLKSFESLSAAAREVSGNSNGMINISKVTRGQLNIAYGYRWSTEKKEKLPKISSSYTGCKKQIYQYTKDKQLIVCYESAVQAAKNLGENKRPSTIRNAAIGCRKTAYGFIWSYEVLY